LLDEYRLTVLIGVYPFLLKLHFGYRLDVGEWVWPFFQFRQQVSSPNGLEHFLLAAPTMTVEQRLTLVIDVYAK
jgi:hypothetical protein